MDLDHVPRTPSVKSEGESTDEEARVPFAGHTPLDQWVDRVEEADRVAEARAQEEPQVRQDIQEFISATCPVITCDQPRATQCGVCSQVGGLVCYCALCRQWTCKNCRGSQLRLLWQTSLTTTEAPFNLDDLCSCQNCSSSHKQWLRAAFRANHSQEEVRNFWTNLGVQYLQTFQSLNQRSNPLSSCSSSQ